MKLTIDRQKWLRGDPNSSLFRSRDEKMCCLGFLALQCGYTPEDIRDIGTPYGAARRYDDDDKLIINNKFPQSILEPLVGSDGYFITADVTHLLIEANDTSRTDDKERETKITELFKQAGIEVEFIN